VEDAEDVLKVLSTVSDLSQEENRRIVKAKENSRYVK